MAFTLDNATGNILTIVNTDEETPLLYTIYVLGDSGVFAPVEGFPEQPTNSLDPLESVDVDLVDDGVYQFITDNTYYIVMNNNLRICEKVYLEKILCVDCECKCKCNEDVKKIQALIKFEVLKERFYYIANKYMQDQSVYDLISPENAEVLYWSDILKQLTRICDNCNKKSNCGCGCS